MSSYGETAVIETNKDGDDLPVSGVHAGCVRHGDGAGHGADPGEGFRVAHGQRGLAVHCHRIQFFHRCRASSTTWDSAAR